MKEIINKQTLDKLAELARVEISSEKEEKLLSDLKNILGHFSELKEVDTAGIDPMNGGTNLFNIIRDDEIIEKDLQKKADNLINAFPEKEDRFLKVPGVFE